MMTTIVNPAAIAKAYGIRLNTNGGLIGINLRQEHYDGTSNTFSLYYKVGDDIVSIGSSYRVIQRDLNPRKEAYDVKIYYVDLYIHNGSSLLGVHPHSANRVPVVSLLVDGQGMILSGKNIIIYDRINLRNYYSSLAKGSKTLSSILYEILLDTLNTLWQSIKNVKLNFKIEKGRINIGADWVTWKEETYHTILATEGYEVGFRTETTITISSSFRLNNNYKDNREAFKILAYLSDNKDRINIIEFGDESGSIKLEAGGEEPSLEVESKIDMKGNLEDNKLYLSTIEKIKGNAETEEIIIELTDNLFTFHVARYIKHPKYKLISLLAIPSQNTEFKASLVFKRTDGKDIKNKEY